MLDVAIIGGGLCGLALAHSLHARRIDWALFEARPQLGGRVRTVHGQHGAEAGVPLDLGPTWFWPATQPSITRLVADLGLASLAQPDDGRVRLLDDPNRATRTLAFEPSTGHLAADEATPATPGALHSGARRLAGGMAALIQALAQPLPGQRLHTGRVLSGLTDHGDHVALQFSDGSALLARRVVLALPPRLVAEHLALQPALPPAVQQALQATPTWMATAAKAAAVCAQATWRQAGEAGNAWVTHPQGVLAEVFDASASADGAPALAGFVALPAAARAPFRASLPLLVDSQLTMLFGQDTGPGTVQHADWATEPHTCSAQDLAEDGRPGGHPVYGEPLLSQPLWDGRLWLGGSETSAQGGGYLEGALRAAARLRQALTPSTGHRRPLAANEPLAQPPHPQPQQPQPQHPQPQQPPQQPQQASAPEALAPFVLWVQQRREGALQRYRQQVHQALAQQRDDQLTQRALLAALESLYQEALDQLATLPLPAVPAAMPSAVAAPAPDGRHALVPLVLAPFSGLADELLAEALRFNATSCALSNFPFEHRPSAAYVHTIRRDLAAAWADFARAANQQLHARASA